MDDSNTYIRAVMAAALDMYLNAQEVAFVEGHKCEAQCGNFRAKVYGGGDATIRVTIYYEPDPEVDSKV